MRTNQQVDSHEDLLAVVDSLLEEMGLDRRDAGGTFTFAGLGPTGMATKRLASPPDDAITHPAATSPRHGTGFQQWRESDPRRATFTGPAS